MLRSLEKESININDYEIIERVGYSMYTYVYKVIEKKTGKVAVFIVYPNFFINGDDMLHELMLRSFVKLPGIINTIDFFLPSLEKRGHNYFIARNSLVLLSDLMTNGNLEPILNEYLKSQGKKNEKMNPTIRSKIIFGVAVTMKQIHQLRLLYEVLSVKNVFLDEKLEPKLGDFVHGSFKRRIPLENTIKHSLPIIKAPEILAYEDDGYSFSSDVYSFAIFLYQMFSPSFIFPDKLFDKYFEQRIERGERFKRPKIIPDNYWNLIQKCWKNEPTERPTFNEIVEILRDDKYAIEEFGLKTNLDKLHEYQCRIDFIFPH